MQKSLNLTPEIINSLSPAKKQELIRLLEEKRELEEGLPHLYGFKFYKWAREFYSSTNKYNFLVSANQVGKSTTQIRKCITWATEPSLWPKLWKTKPTQFWYFYPTRDLGTIEFNEKWIKEFLPRGKFKDDPKYGWKADYRQKEIHSIDFNSGVTVYFKSYEQDPKNIQAASVYSMFCDEECPVDHYSELNARLIGTEGYWHNVFTATLGQYYWYQVIELRGTADEKLKDALKIQVSMYDCLEYEDGTPTPWSKERIRLIEMSCRSEAEVKRRVYGRFAVDDDLSYPAFNRSKNCVKEKPKDISSWSVFTGVDVGSGGARGHPAAYIFVAVNSAFTKAIAFAGKRMDGIVTTAGDILEDYKIMRSTLKPIAQYYDHASKEFGLISNRVGEPFLKADKDRDTSSRLLNVLFRAKMLDIYSDDPELQKLIIELETLKITTQKNIARDDFIDALRFAVINIPWDFSFYYGQISQDPKKQLKPEITDPRERLYKNLDRKDNDGLDLLESEFKEANSFYDYYGYDD